MFTFVKKWIGIFSLILVLIPCVNAKELSQVSKLEIQQLLARLSASKCQFNRNGSWYTSEEASAHLTKKLNYVVEKGKVSTTEEFIELAASKSSTSGKPYQVKCGDSGALESAAWLTTQL